MVSALMVPVVSRCKLTGAEPIIVTCTFRIVLSPLFLQELGMQLPPGFSAEMVGENVGLDHKVHTIDVATQKPGPRMPLGQFQHLFALNH